MEPISETELLRLIEKSLGLDPNNVDLFTSMDSFEEWDSLGHLNILIALDLRLNELASNIMDLATADSVEKIVRLLRNSYLLK